MEKFILQKEKLIDFLKALGNYDLFAPVRKDGVTVFARVNNIDGATFDLKNQPLPPKKGMYPQTESLFTFDNKTNAMNESEMIPTKQRVIFGLRPCDARSFLILDPVFEQDYPDPYYLGKRKSTVLIGINCSEPFTNCFCTSVGGSPVSHEGLDLLIIELPTSYFFEIISPAGEMIMAETALVLSPACPEDEKAKDDILKAGEEKIKRSVEIKNFPEKIEKIFDNPIWKDLALKCISCGICTYTCPTCYCFDIQDELLKGGGKRQRIWDSCMFKDYTLHASGHNPRPSRAERLRNRIYHKFRQNIGKYGVAGCVGCGRCISLCPVNEDLIENLIKIKEL